MYLPIGAFANSQKYCIDLVPNILPAAFCVFVCMVYVHVHVHVCAFLGYTTTSLVSILTLSIISTEIPPWDTRPSFLKLSS